MCQSKNNAGTPGSSPCSACAKCKGKGNGNCAAKKIARDLARAQKGGQTPGQEQPAAPGQADKTGN